MICINISSLGFIIFVAIGIIIYLSLVSLKNDLKDQKEADKRWDLLLEEQNKIIEDYKKKIKEIFQED